MALSNVSDFTLGVAAVTVTVAVPLVTAPAKVAVSVLAKPGSTPGEPSNVAQFQLEPKLLARVPHSPPPLVVQVDCPVYTVPLVVTDPGEPMTVAVPLERPATPLALLTSDRATVLLSEPAVPVPTATTRLFRVAPPAEAARPVNPLADTSGLPVDADTLSESWKEALVTVWLPMATVPLVAAPPRWR